MLARDLEDEASEGVERRQLAEPGSRPELGTGIVHPRKDGDRLAEELPRRGIGDRSTCAGPTVDAHPCTLPPVSPQRSRACATPLGSVTPPPPWWSRGRAGCTAQ